MDKELQEAIDKGAFIYAAELVGESGDKNLLKDLYTKEENKLSNYTSEDLAKDEEMEGYNYEDNDVKLAKEQKLFSLSLAIKHILKDTDWSEKIEAETLERAKKLEYYTDFLFHAILITKTYDTENPKIIEFLKLIEQNGPQKIKKSDFFEDFGDFYNKLYQEYKYLPQGSDKELLYDKTNAATCLKNAEEVASEASHFQSLVLYYFKDFDDKEKALEMMDKMKQNSDLKDSFQIMLVVQTYLDIQMENEATNFFNEVITKLDDKKDIESLQNDFKEALKHS